MTSKLEWALSLAGLGWSVFPLEPNGKKPLTRNGFKDATTSVYRIRRWWEDRPDANIGVATGKVSGIAPLDVDVKNGAKGRESLASLHGMPPTLTVRTPSGGWHLYYLCPEEGLASKNGLLPGIDLKADGGYVVGPGSTIDNNPYEWLDAEAHIAAMPEVVIALRRNGTNGRVASPPIPDVIPEGERNSTLASLAGAMRRKGADVDSITAALKVANAKRCRPPLSDAEVETISASIGRYAPEPSAPTANGTEPSANGSSEDEPMPPGFTDDALALEFTEGHAADWRYVAGWGRWLQWDGCRWAKEGTLRAFDEARRVCRQASARCRKPKIAAKVASASTVAAVEKLARADRRHAATAEQWDADLGLANTPAGAATLKIGLEE